jgi:hypothetical protein
MSNITRCATFRALSPVSIGFAVTTDGVSLM